MDTSKTILFDRIRDALLKEWDPIGIQDYPEAQDEYTAYIPDICELLTRKESSSTVFDYLWQVETGHMGLVGDRGRTQAFADRLIRMSTDSD